MRRRTGRFGPGAQPGSSRGAGLSLRLALSVAMVLAAILGPAVSCCVAGLVIEAPNLGAVAPGSSGSFDLLLMNTNALGGASYDVAADSFGLSLVGPLSVTFTGVSINTVVPYIYVTSGTTQGGGPLSLGPFPNTQFTAFDSEFASPGFQTVNPGDTFGLANVAYAVSPTTPNGTDTITLVGLATTLSDVNGSAIPFTISNGSLRVGAAIPEPSALIQAATAALIGLGALWWRRRAR
jgi:hypothetical protein